MNTNEQATQPMQADIDIEYEFSQAPAQVWRVLSEPDLLAQWLLPNDLATQTCKATETSRAAETGLRFSFGSESNRIDCEVLASEPERLLSYSWRSGPSGGDLDTVVTFVLTETADGGTHLRLTHRGFPQSAQIISLVPRARAVWHSSSEVKMLWAA